jgi:NTP pyrophosphatase (non-canonical NTP hydrolase)
VGDEVADVLIYLVQLADRSKVDLAAAVARKLEKNARKYPARGEALAAKKGAGRKVPRG